MLSIAYLTIIVCAIEHPSDCQSIPYEETFNSIIECTIESQEIMASRITITGYKLDHIVCSDEPKVEEKGA